MELMDAQEVSDSSSIGNGLSSSDRRKRKREARKSAAAQDSSETSLTSHSSSKACRESPSTCSPVMNLPSTSTSNTTAPKISRHPVGLNPIAAKFKGGGPPRPCVYRHHECMAVIRDRDERDPSKGVVCKLRCQLNDMVSYDSAPCSTRRVLTRTGKHCVDQAAQQLSTRSLNCVDMIHHGSYSHVLLAYSLSSFSYYAVKLVHKGTHVCKRALRNVKPCSETAGNINEVKYLQQLKHPNIVSIIDSMVTDFGKTAIVLEHCPIGRLQEVLDTCVVMAEIVARRYFNQMFDAVAFIHSTDLAVMNICLSHFLLTNSNVVKMIDLGQVEEQSQKLRPSSHPLPGVYGYRAPETVCVRDEAYYPGPCDVWSLAICLYRMVTGHTPAHCHSIPEQVFPRLYKPVSNKPSSQLVELLEGAFAHPPLARFTLNQVRYSDWLKQKSELPCITGYYLLRKPKKVGPGRQELGIRKEIEL